LKGARAHLRGRANRLGLKAVRHRRELDEIERVLGGQARDDRRHDPASVVERPALHRSARVDQHDEIARDARRANLGTRRHDREKTVDGLAMRRTQARTSVIDRHANGGTSHLPPDDGVAIEGRCIFAIRDAHVEGASLGLAHDDAMGRRLWHTPGGECISN
jgi:hypothetical protein